MASRTLLVNPENDQKQAYQIANEAIDVCIKSLVVGQPIKNAYIAAKEFIASKDKNLTGQLHTNFGFGIGTNIKEDQLLINETNENLVQPNMSFHVRITLTGVNKKPSRGVIAIGETVLIENDNKFVILTSGIQRKYSEISYSLDISDNKQDNGHAE